MLFNSPEFIFLFLPITLIVFFQLGGRGYYQGALTWLMLASLFFYGWWNPPYLGLLLGSIVFNYWIGCQLSKKNIYLNKKLLLIIGISLNLFSIGYFKYADFFIDNINSLTINNINYFNLILPLGISFFTFQQIAYLVDAYQGNTKEYGFLHYTLFVSFFPQLIAGPIVHHQDIMPQFAKKEIYRFNHTDLAVGITIFSAGLCKKVIFADSVAVYATPIFTAASQGIPLTLPEAWTGALAYSLQLYFDFSGYSDMAIGAARMFGIKLPLNFYSPYKAENIIDFWRRWHITLSHFLRDYLYIPLGGNRFGKLRRYTNLMVTMLLGGLWHGAGWTFVFWGGLHGVYLIVNHQWQAWQKSNGNNTHQGSWWQKLLSWLITFVAVAVAWVFFRAENMQTALNVLRGMIGANGISLPRFLAMPFGFLQIWGVQFNGIREGSTTSLPSNQASLWICGLLLIAWFAPNLQQWLSNYQPVLKLPNNQMISGWKKLLWQPSFLAGSVLGIIDIYVIMQLFSSHKSEFLYFNF